MHKSANECSVLVIEDSIDLQSLLARILRDDGYNVICASGGREALELLNNSQTLPKVIMLDLMMADMDGYQFRAAQAQNPRIKDIPVIVMTADGNISGKSSSLSAQAFLKKPFKGIDDILDTVSKFC